MDRVYKSGGTGVAPDSAQNASGPYPRAGDAGTGTAATKPGPYWYHMITEEIAKFVEASGLVAAKATLTQMIDSAFLLFDSQGIDPGGRLTLTTGVPTTTADVAGAATHYYAPAKHNRVKLYDGTRWKWYTFAELSQAANDNTKSPAAVAASKNYDAFVWDDAGTVRCTRGPTWDAGAVAGNDTQRGTGAASTELEFFEGRWVNKNAITNGPAARRGLYAGSLRSDGASQYNDTLAKRHVFNAYNDSPRPLKVIDSADSWAYTTQAWRQANNNAANQFDVLFGLPGVRLQATATACAISSSGVVGCFVGIGVDVTNAYSGLATYIPVRTDSNGSGAAFYNAFPGLGRHIITWLEFGNSNVTFKGDDNVPLSMQSGMIGEIRA